MKSRFLVPIAWLSSVIAVCPLLGQRVPQKTETARFGNPTSIARVYQDYIYGVVKKIDDRALVLDKTVFGNDQTFVLEPKTKFVHDGKPSSPANLKPGDQVWIDVRKDKKRGEMIAKKVVTGVAVTP